MEKDSCEAWDCGSHLQHLVSTRIPWQVFSLSTFLASRSHSPLNGVPQIHHLQAQLSLRLRTRLSRYTHDLYLSSDPYLRYYRVAGEGGLEGVDQYITSDIASWTDALSGL